jgi:isoquinoline 1-oxidoreductase alpha subunit
MHRMFAVDRIPAMTRYLLNVNGQPREAEAAADTPLLWVLRDALGLVGAKFGCGVGQCGACRLA